MKRTLITAFIFLVALATIAGSRGSAAYQNFAGTSTTNEIAAPQKNSGEELREEFHQNYPMSGTGRITVANINGAVRIQVWDQNEVKVDAVKRAYRKERLDEAKIIVNSTGDSVRVRTDYPDRDQTFTDEEGRRSNNPATVEYSLTIPRHARIDSVELINGALEIDGAEGDVKASSINGTVKARALAGEVRLSTVNGPLEATFTRLDESKPVNLSSVNGNIVLIIPSDANAQVRAGTVHGGITNDFNLPVSDGEYVGHELYGQIGTGGARVKLGNVNGRITIKHASDGRAVSQGRNLLTNKEKFKSDHDLVNAQEINEQVREATEAAREATRDALRDRMNEQRMTHDAQIQAQHEIERSIRESQREVQRAQNEIQREVQRSLRENRTRTGDSWGQVVDRDTRTMQVSGTPTVKVNTFDGSVTVRGWDKSEVTYTAIKRADTQEALSKIHLQVDQRQADIQLRATSEDREAGSTAFELYVPKNANLDLSSEDGRVSVQGVSGQVTIHTGDGAIEIESGQGRLQANTKDGRIRVISFQGSVDASTDDGAIMLDGEFTGVQAKTGDGSIVLGVPSSSNFVVETNAETIHNEGLTMSEEAATTGRAKRWKVGSGGPVFLLNTGDGRVILRLH